MASEPEMVVKRVSVPLGLEELMETLTKEVLRKKPDDIYTFASEYFSKLLSIRNKANYKVPQPSTNGSLRKEYTKNDVLKIKTATIGTSMKLKNEQPPFPIRRINKRNVKAKVDSNLSPRTPQNDNINGKVNTLQKCRLSKSPLDSKKRDAPKSMEAKKDKLKRSSSKSSSRSTISSEEIKPPSTKLVNVDKEESNNNENGLESTINQKETSSMSMEKAAILIQSLVRSFITRRRLRKVDKIFGGDVQPSVNKEIISEMDNFKNEAATKIQSVWRGHKIRKNVNVKSDDTSLTEEQRRKAATVIQALFRGYLSRKAHKYIPKVINDDKERLSTLLEEDLEKINNIKEEIESSDVIKNVQTFEDRIVNEEIESIDVINNVQTLEDRLVNEEKDLIKEFVNKDDSDVFKAIIEKDKDVIEVSSETQPNLIENVESPMLQKNPSLTDLDLKSESKNKNLISTPEEETLKVIIENGVDVVEISSEPQEKNVEKLDVESIKRPISKDSTTSADSVDTVIFSNNQLVTKFKEETQREDTNLECKEVLKKNKEEQVHKEITRYLTTITEPLRRAFSAETPSTPQKEDKMLKERSLSAQETESPKYIYIPLRQYSEDGDNLNKNENDDKPDIQIEPKIEKEIFNYSPNKEISAESNGAINEYINSIIEPVKQKFSPNTSESIVKKPILVEPEYQYIPLRTYSEDKENLLDAANGKSYQQRIEQHLKNGVEEKALTRTVSEQIDDIIQEANQVVDHEKKSDIDSSKIESNGSRNKRQVSFNEDDFIKEENKCLCEDKKEVSVENFNKEDVEKSKRKCDGAKLNECADANMKDEDKLDKGVAQEESLKENVENKVTKDEEKDDVELKAGESPSLNEISIQEKVDGDPKNDFNENTDHVANVIDGKDTKMLEKSLESNQLADKLNFLEVSQVQESQNNSKPSENCLKNFPSTETDKDMSESDVNDNQAKKDYEKSTLLVIQGDHLNVDPQQKLNDQNQHLPDIKTSETFKTSLETGEPSTDDTLDNIALDSLESESFPINEVTKVGQEPELQNSVRDEAKKACGDASSQDVKKGQALQGIKESVEAESIHDVGSAAKCLNDDIIQSSNSKKAAEVETKSQIDEKNDESKSDKSTHSFLGNVNNDIIQLPKTEKAAEMDIKTQKGDEKELDRNKETPTQHSILGESSKSDKSTYVSARQSDTNKGLEVETKSQKGEEVGLEKNEKSPLPDLNYVETSKNDKSTSSADKVNNKDVKELSNNEKSEEVSKSDKTHSFLGNVNNDIQLVKPEKAAEVDIETQEDDEKKLEKNEETLIQNSIVAESLKSDKSTDDSTLQSTTNNKKELEVTKSQKGEEVGVEKNEISPVQGLNDIDTSNNDKSNSSAEEVNEDVKELFNNEKAEEVDTKSNEGDAVELETKEETPAQDVNDGNKLSCDLIPSTEKVSNDVIQLTNTEKVSDADIKSPEQIDLQLGKNEKKEDNKKKEGTPIQNSNDGESSKNDKSTSVENVINNVVQLSNTENIVKVDIKSQKEDGLKLEKNEETQNSNDGESLKNDKSIPSIENVINDVKLSNTENAAEVDSKSQKGDEVRFKEKEEIQAQDLNNDEASKSGKSTYGVISSADSHNNDAIQQPNTEKVAKVDVKSKERDDLKVEKNETFSAQDSNFDESSKSDKSTHDVNCSAEMIKNDSIEEVSETGTKSNKEDDLKVKKMAGNAVQHLKDSESLKSDKLTNDVIYSADALNNDAKEIPNNETVSEVDTKSHKEGDLKVTEIAGNTYIEQDSKDSESLKSDKLIHDVNHSANALNNDAKEIPNTEKVSEADTKSQKENELKEEKNEKTSTTNSNNGELSKSDKSTHDIVSSTQIINNDAIQSSNTEIGSDVDTKLQKGCELSLKTEEEIPGKESNDSESSKNDNSTHDVISSMKNVNNDVVQLSNTEKAAEVDTILQKGDELKLEKIPDPKSNDDGSSGSDKSIHDVISSTENVSNDVKQSNMTNATELDTKLSVGNEEKLEKIEDSTLKIDESTHDTISCTENENHDSKICNKEKAEEILDETQKVDLKLENVEKTYQENSESRNELPTSDESIREKLGAKEGNEVTQQQELHVEKTEITSLEDQKISNELTNIDESTHHLTTTDTISTQNEKEDNELLNTKIVNEKDQKEHHNKGGEISVKPDDLKSGVEPKDEKINFELDDNHGIDSKAEKINAAKIDVKEEEVNQELNKENNGKSKINETDEIKLISDVTDESKKDETNSIEVKQSSDNNLNINTKDVEKIIDEIENKDKTLNNAEMFAQKSTLQGPTTLKEAQSIKENQSTQKIVNETLNRKDIITKQSSSLESVSEDGDVEGNVLKSSNNTSELSMDHGTTNLYMSTFKAPTYPISNGNITDNYKIYKLEHLGFGEDVEGRKSISPIEVNCSSSRSLPSLPEEDTQPDDVIKESASPSESKSEPFYLHRQGDSPKLIPSSDQEKAFSKAFQKANGIKYDSVPIRGNLGSSGSSTEELNYESSLDSNFQQTKPSIDSTFDSRHNKPSSPHPSVQCNISVVDGSSPTSALPLALEMSQSAAGAAFVTETTLSGAQAQNCASTRDQADIDQNEHQQRAESVVVMDTVKRNNSSIIKKTQEQQAATKIQASFRGYQVRKKLKNKTISPKSNGVKRLCRRKSSGRMDPNKNSNKKPTDLEQQSATKIQAGVRGFLVRRRQKKNKSVPESP